MVATDTPPFDVLSLVPEGTPDEVIPAWLSALYWTHGQKSAVDAFHAQTGYVHKVSWEELTSFHIAPTASSIEYLTTFTEWFNTKVWGEVMSDLSAEDDPQ